MSWITGLADKAENILNKLDQNAATALQTPLGGESVPTTYGMSVSTTMQSIPSTIIKKSKSSSMLSLMTPLSSPAKQTSFNDLAFENADSVARKAVNAPFEAVENREWPTRPFKPYLASSKTDVAIEMDADNVSDAMATINVVKESPRKAVTKFSTQDSGENEEILALRMAMAELTSEREILRNSLNAQNSDAENTGLIQHIHELELLTDSLTAERNQVQCKLEESQLACSRYLHSISELSANLAELKQEYNEVSQKLQMQIKETAQTSKDLQEYRVKAHRALQIKDSIISELKLVSCGEGAVVPGNEDVKNMNLLQIQIESFKQEQQHLRDENSTLLENLKKVKNDLLVLEEQHSELIITNRTNEDDLRKALSLEKEHSLQLESEQRVISQELNSLRQQLMSASMRLQEREQFIQQFQTQQKTRVASAVIDEYNMRIKSLTQALVDKQNSLEQITADRNALRIQLEKVQDQLHQSLLQNKSSSNSVQRNVLLSNTTDDVKAQLPLLMKETPFDNRVARRVKRAYSSLDSAGIRLEAFLRRYPLMRVFVLMYMGLLHIWVIFVLLSSTPT